MKAVFQKWLTKGSSGKATIVLNVPALGKALVVITVLKWNRWQIPNIMVLEKSASP